MRSKSFMAVAGLLVVLIALAGAMLVYDSGRKDTIAKGISVGGVDVGGLKRAAAEAKLRAQVADPLRQPIVGTFRKHHFTLTPERAKVVVDVEGSVSAALDRSRNGGILKRTVRNITGGKVNDDLDVDIRFDQAAVPALVKRVREHLNRPAVDADVDISTTGVETVRSKPGLAVKVRALRHSIRRRLVSATVKRTFAIKAETLKPKVTTKELAKKYPEVIVINRGAYTLQLYDNLKPAKSYTIAVGMAGLETPQGLYHIQDKQVNPYWHVPNSAWAGDLAGQVIPPGPSNPIQARWMGIYNGAGIHGTTDVGSLGSAASHGCVRMSIPDVEDLYDRVDVGTPVYVG
ncbi:MAG: L,D-transpeptidase ErfK/SrfK [Solirubrobacteraceae bacterium]|nr:L,D-transpeptidase ErfK/SrfK [Solirubrobacteraceae bacterium]